MCADGRYTLDQLERTYRSQVDSAAHRPFNGFRFRRFGHFNSSDNGRRNIFKIDPSTSGTRVHGRHTIDFGTVCVSTTNLNAGTDTGRSSNLDPCHILKHLCKVLVRQLAYIFRLNDFDQIVRIALFFKSACKRRPDTDDNNFRIFHRLQL